MLVMMKPYGGQADTGRLTAREGSRDPRAHGASVTRSEAPSQRGPATGPPTPRLRRVRRSYAKAEIGIHLITNATELRSNER